MIWLKRIGWGMAGLLLWVVLTGLFLSKERLCNALIERAGTYGITLCFERTERLPLGCALRRLRVEYADSPVARIDTFSVKPWRVEADRIRLSGLAADALPPRIEKVLFLPLEGKIHAVGDFGTLDGDLSYRRRTLTLRLTPSTLMRGKYRATLRTFKPKDGKYLYETSF